MKPRAENYEEEEDPFFYHLDLSNYEESLETYCHDNFFFQNARLQANQDKAASPEEMDPYQNSQHSSMKNLDPNTTEKAFKKIELPLVNGEKLGESQRKSLIPDQERLFITGDSTEKQIQPLNQTP